MTVRVRLTRKLADILNGIDLTHVQPGNEVELSRADARLLIAEGWAEPVPRPIAAAHERIPRHANRMHFGAGRVPAAPTILVVDDDPSIQLLLAELLERRGFRVRTATAASEAIALLDVTQVSAIVLDIRMPGRSGLAVLRHIREQPELRELPVLVLTGATLTPEEKRAIRHGRADVFSKGRNLEALLAHIDRVTTTASSDAV